MLDVLVIGAGLAGLTAALTAAEAGLSVRVVAKGLGALHWNAGTIDVLGYLPGSDFAVDEPLAALEQLPAEHPYRLLGRAQVDAALQRMQERLAAAGLPYAGAAQAGRNLLLPSAVGAVRPTLLAPQAQLAGALPGGAPMLIAGVEGLRDFYPHLIAENLVRQGVQARAAFVPWAAVSDQHDRNAVQLAAGLDDPAQRRRYAQALAPLVRPGERVALPAILGLDAHAVVLADLRAATGAELCEVPLLPPSVPGIRLFQTLRRLLAQANVRIESNMEVTAYSSRDGRVEYVESATAARPLRHSARAFVLATGGVLGGGFNSSHDGRIWETIFKLPLTVANDRSSWFRPRFLDPHGHPVFLGGVQVGSDLRPRNADGAPAFENLWAAGGVLAHADPIHERSLEGLAIASGAAAGAALTAALASPAPAAIPA